MVKMAKIKSKQRIKKILLAGLLIFAGLSIVGFIYEKIVEVIDAKTITPPGQIVMVDGHKMHIYCTGENEIGKPTVILDSGAGDNWESWRRVQPEVAKRTRVCSYDRSGLGFSETAKNDHSNVTVAKELEELLQVANIQPPYIMVGHSIGGFNIRLFAQNNKDKIVGLVFVDPSLEGMQKSEESLSAKISFGLISVLARYVTGTGLYRLILTAFPDFRPYTTSNAVSRAGVATVKVMNTTIKESKNVSYDAVKSADNFGSVPLIVLTSKETAAYDPSWLFWSKDLARTSSNGKQITVKDSSHYIQIDQPQIIVDSIIEEL